MHRSPWIFAVRLFGLPHVGCFQAIWRTYELVRRFAISRVLSGKKRWLTPKRRARFVAVQLGWPVHCRLKFCRVACCGLAYCRLVCCTVATAAGPFAFSDVTPQSGVQFRHTDGSSGRYFIIEYVSAGLATLDYDRDGDLDLYFLNGARLPGAEAGAEANALPTNALYRNDGGWHFTDVTQQACVGDTGHGLGLAVGDYDNDGDADLYL